MSGRCGGCRDLGAHSRWCREVVGYRASRIGAVADDLEGIGDMIGAANSDLANECYKLSQRLTERAKFEAKKERL